MSSNGIERSMLGPSGSRSTRASEAKWSASGAPGSAAIAVSANQFRELMSAITVTKDRMDEKLAKFQDKIRQGQEEAAMRTIKRSRYEKSYVFRKHGNEEQASFNAKVDETLAQAEINLSGVEHGSAATSAVQRIREAIQKGRSLLEECQKLLQLANHSEHGWGVVDEYTVDDLAEYSDDEKRIEKAERVAERKAGKRRKKRGTGAVKSRGGSPHFPVAVQPPVMRMPVTAAPYNQPRWQTLPPPTRPIGPCHFCGEMGHLSLSCPVRAMAVSRKWYPFQRKCVLGVDVEHRKSIYSAAKCVRGVGVRTSDVCCEGIESRESVDYVDAESSVGLRQLCQHNFGHFRAAIA